MTIPVGPERDRAVAEMLGLRPCAEWVYFNLGSAGGPAYSHGRIGGPKATCPGNCYPEERGPSPYSTSPAAAFEALEMWKSAGKGRWYTINRWGDIDAFEVTIYPADDNYRQVEAPTFPDAATAALLRAGGNHGD